MYQKFLKCYKGMKDALSDWSRSWVHDVIVRKTQKMHSPCYDHYIFQEEINPEKLIYNVTCCVISD